MSALLDLWQTSVPPRSERTECAVIPLHTAYAVSVQADVRAVKHTLVVRQLNVARQVIVARGGEGIRFAPGLPFDVCVSVVSVIAVSAADAMDMRHFIYFKVFCRSYFVGLACVDGSGVRAVGFYARFDDNAGSNIYNASRGAVYYTAVACCNERERAVIDGNCSVRIDSCICRFDCNVAAIYDYTLAIDCVGIFIGYGEFKTALAAEDEPSARNNATGKA